MNSSIEGCSLADTLAPVMTDTRSIDILMITYRRPHYTRLALDRLLATCDESMRVWLWHNGDHAETLELVKSYESHPRVHRFHHCPENLRLREPTNWLFRESTGAFVTKVDDDCLMPFGWADTLRAAMDEEPRFGMLGCWRFQEEDFDADLAGKKIQTFGRHKVLRNMWVEGSGYLMRRACVQQAGPIRERESFSTYGIRVGCAGWINGWYWPPLRQAHLDDPREPLSAIKSDADVLENLPLSAIRANIRTRAAWINRLQRSAREVQTASIEPSHYHPFRVMARRGIVKMKRWLWIDRHGY